MPSSRVGSLQGLQQDGIGNEEQVWGSVKWEVCVNSLPLRPRAQSQDQSSHSVRVWL